jgi:Family of unknown function (DUF6662)
MKPSNPCLFGLLCCAALASSASATERFFTYSYEPETMPKGAMEYEQWVTLRAGRNKTVGQENYNKWEIREELEYGVTDNYTVSLYLNQSSESFRDPLSGENHSDFRFDGISIENRYQVLNPADHAVGLALYLEPRYAGDEAELEEKIILGQRHGDWKWALNLTHATEWEDNFHETEGELEVSFGLTRNIGKNWSIGFEARDHNELPEYKEWENTALFIGPVVTYRQEKWWATLTVMPQVLGVNFSENVDQDHHFELEGHERVNARLIVGISF